MQYLVTVKYNVSSFNFIKMLYNLLSQTPWGFAYQYSDNSEAMLEENNILDVVYRWV